jgi:hypothetical protein
MSLCRFSLKVRWEPIRKSISSEVCWAPIGNSVARPIRKLVWHTLRKFLARTAHQKASYRTHCLFFSKAPTVTHFEALSDFFVRWIQQKCQHPFSSIKTEPFSHKTTSQTEAHRFLASQGATVGLAARADFSCWSPLQHVDSSATSPFSNFCEAPHREDLCRTYRFLASQGATVDSAPSAGSQHPSRTALLKTVASSAAPQRRGRPQTREASQTRLIPGAQAL